MDSTEYLTQHINVAATDTNRPKEGMWDLVLQSSKQNPAALSAISQFFAPPEQDNNSGELPAEHETLIDLKVYERGASVNHTLRNILARLYTQYTELFMLAYEVYSRTRRNGHAYDPQGVIPNFLRALYIPLPGHPLRALTMDRLAVCLKTQYVTYGDPVNLKEAIIYAEGASSLCPKHLPIRPFLLERLANSLLIWFNEQGGTERLEKAVSYYREALEGRPSANPSSESTVTMSWLGVCLQALYRQSGTVQHLEEAMQWLRATQQSLPLVEPQERAWVFNNLSTCLEAGYLQENKIDYLDKAIYCAREAISLVDPDDMDRAGLINNLAMVLNARYCQLGETENLEEAIRCSREAARIYPVGHPMWSSALVTQSKLLLTWSEWQGGVEELEDAIKQVRDVLSAFPSTCLQRIYALTMLGDCLQRRFRHYWDAQDLEDAIQCYMEELLQLQPDIPHYVLTVLQFCDALSLRYTLLHNCSDLDMADKVLREALLLCPEGHRLRINLLNTLANCLLSKYLRRGGLQTLQEAIKSHRKALSCCSQGDSIMQNVLIDLSRCLVAQYEHSGDVRDLKEGVEGFQEFIHTIPSSHPTQVPALAHLALTFAEHTDELKAFYDVTESSALFKKACEHPTGNLRDRLDAAGMWLGALVGSSTLPVYEQFFKLVDQYLLLRPSVTSRYQLLQSLPHETALIAAATAIGCGQVTTAVEFLEQGRTFLWSQMNRYRTPLDKLQRTHPELAREFTRLSQLLENSAVSKFLTDSPQLSAEAEARKYRNIAEDWSTVVDEIRQVKGFDAFLRSPEYSSLRLASRNGPVIIVNIRVVRCDAIIIREEDDPVLVPLPEADRSNICDNAEKFNKSVKAGIINRSQIIGILRELWNEIALPVVRKLEELNVAHGSRIWWCLTSALAMLPIHAAGPHLGKKPNLCDIYISSYTPTLSTLAELNQEALPPAEEQQSHGDHCLLVVAQPKTSKGNHLPPMEKELSITQKSLPCAEKELSIIEQQVPGVSVLLDEGGTYEKVLAGIKTHNWVHFACHGSQDLKEPFASCFHLHDKPLTLLNIVEARLPDAQFAFLSACHGAAADVIRPDETIHLAAALQFIGFRSVIGTMYAMGDIDGPVVAEEVYKHMYRHKEKGGSVNYRDAAEALSIAVKKLREKKVPVERWINFVHFGA